jgi:hypothetical protein
LASAAHARERDEPARSHLLDLADSVLARVGEWASVGPATFAHKRDLIRAELCAARGEYDAAAAAYDAAAQSAAASGFLHDQALVHERAGLFHQAAEDAEKARAHLDKASVLYQRWEAAAKVDALRETRV